MGRYQIICTRQSPPTANHDHAHITQAGIPTTDGGVNTYGVTAIRKRMDDGDQFFTKSPTTGAEAAVHKFTCGHCGYNTIRSGADAITDNNLDNLPRC